MFAHKQHTRLHARPVKAGSGHLDDFGFAVERDHVELAHTFDRFGQQVIERNRCA
jgi:hypothetical protein